MALIIGGVVGLLVFLITLLFLREPTEEQERLEAHTFSWSAVGRVLGNRDLWFMGLSFLGVYGAGLTMAQLLGEYMGITYHISAATGGLMAAILTLMAIPGSILGGVLADRAKTLKPVIIIPWIIMGLALIVFPFVGAAGTWVVIIIVGGAQSVGLAGWTSTPGLYKDRVFPEDIATAEGLMLTLAGIGGFVVSAVFGQIASGGFTGAWIFAGIISVVFALIGFAAREPSHIGATESSESVQTVAATAGQNADATS